MPFIGIPMVRLVTIVGPFGIAVLTMPVPVTRFIWSVPFATKTVLVLEALSVSIAELWTAASPVYCAMRKLVLVADEASCSCHCGMI
jgi:hypothetical protein